jgi:hypothetical protein
LSFKGQLKIKAMSHSFPIFSDELLLGTDNKISFSISPSLKLYPNSMDERFKNLSNVSTSVMLNGTFAFNLCAYFSNQIPQAYISGKLICYTQLFQLDFAYNYSENDIWKRQLNMSTASLALDFHTPLSDSEHGGLLGWRNRFDFGNFKKYEWFPGPRDIRYIPSLYVIYSIPISRNSLSLLFAVSFEAFNSSVQWMINQHLSIDYSFKSKSRLTTPRTPLEKGISHNLSMTFRI